jgi:ribosomal protein S18 acetylase RimI-like enzyme
MNVRRLVCGDEKLWSQAAVAVIGAGQGERLATEREVAVALADPRSYLFVATREAKPVGLLSAYRFPDVVSGGEIVYLYDIEVLSEHRRQGFGAQLLAALVESCEREGVKLIWAGTDVDNTAARRAFEASGAELEGESYVEYEWDFEEDDDPERTLP